MRNGFREANAKRARRRKRQPTLVRRLSMEPLDPRTMLSATNLAALIGHVEGVPTETSTVATRLAPRLDEITHSIRASATVEAPLGRDVGFAPAGRSDGETPRESVLASLAHAVAPRVGQQHPDDRSWRGSVDMLPGLGRPLETSPLDLRLARTEFVSGILTRAHEADITSPTLWLSGRPMRSIDVSVPSHSMRPTSMLAIAVTPLALAPDSLNPGGATASALETKLLTSFHDISPGSAETQGDRIGNSLVDLYVPPRSGSSAYAISQVATIETSSEDADALVRLAGSNRLALTGSEGGFVELGKLRDPSPSSAEAGFDREAGRPEDGSRTGDMHESPQAASENRGRMLRWLRLAPATLEHVPTDGLSTVLSEHPGAVIDRDEGGMIALVAAANPFDDWVPVESSAIHLLTGDGSPIPTSDIKQIRMGTGVGMFLDFELATALSTIVNASNTASQGDPAGNSTADRSEPAGDPDEAANEQTASVSVRPHWEHTAAFSAVLVGACLVAVPRRRTPDRMLYRPRSELFHRRTGFIPFGTRETE